MTRWGPTAGAAALVTLAIAGPVLAETYAALCEGDAPCSVSLGDGAITAAGQRIPKEQVLRWTLAGRGSTTDAGMGMAGNVLGTLPGVLRLPGLPILPGLIGSFAVHDYRFAIHYIDADGQPQVSTIRFVNNVPAQQFMTELAGLTQLSLGQENDALRGRIEAIRAQAEERRRLEALRCSAVLQPHACSWSRYLEANPDLRLWSESNPRLVPAEKARLGAVD